MGRRTPAQLAAASLVGLSVGLLGCSDGSSPGSRPALPAATSSPTPAPASRSANDADADAETDAALSDPVEDSVYPDVGDPSVDALHYNLDLTWAPQTKTLEGRAGIELRSSATGDHLQLDLAPDLDVSRVTLDGSAVDFTHQGKDLRILAPVVADQRYLLDVHYSGAAQPWPAPVTRSDFDATGWTVTDSGEVWTIQEPYGAFTWYPVNDQPSDKARYDVEVTAPAPLVAVSNGELVAQTTTDRLTTSRWHLAAPAAAYLVTLAIGDYEHTTNTSASGVEISYWVPSERPGLAEQISVAADALDWLEPRLGHYPFDSLGFVVVDSMSAVETQTMITLGAGEYVTSEPVLLHELAHQWYGDAVTPQDWSDLWMNEGMAMYLQIRWQAERDGDTLDEAMDYWAGVEPELRAKYGPPGGFDREDFGSGNVYYSTALMWHELRNRIGEQRFLEVTRAWIELGPDRSASREEYLTWLVEQTGVSRSFFDDWLLSPSTPGRLGPSAKG